KNNQKLLNQYTIFPIKVCTNELEDHHDLLLFGDGSVKMETTCNCVSGVLNRTRVLPQNNV
ncbi:Uncharacterized protein FWK35_00029803, partial [Aphis craccivora]